MSKKPYQPSNGTEGLMFQEEWCWRCVRDRAAREGKPEDGCEILAATMFLDVKDPNYPKEWIYDPDKMLKDGCLTIGAGGACCTAFKAAT